MRSAIAVAVAVAVAAMLAGGVLAGCSLIGGGPDADPTAACAVLDRALSADKSSNDLDANWRSFVGATDEASDLAREANDPDLRATTFTLEERANAVQGTGLDLARAKYEVATTDLQRVRDACEDLDYTWQTPPIEPVD